MSPATQSTTAITQIVAICQKRSGSELRLGWRALMGNPPRGFWVFFVVRVAGAAQQIAATACRNHFKRLRIIAVVVVGCGLAAVNAEQCAGFWQQTTLYVSLDQSLRTVGERVFGLPPSRGLGALRHEIRVAPEAPIASAGCSTRARPLALDALGSLRGLDGGQRCASPLYCNPRWLSIRDPKAEDCM